MTRELEARRIRADASADRLRGLSRWEIEHLGELGLPAAYRDGELEWGGVRMADLADEFGTPLLVYDLGRVRDNARALRSALEQTGHRYRVAYAMKACYAAPVVKAAMAEGLAVEVMSDLELQLAIGHGCGPDQLVTNGLGRSQVYNQRTAGLQPWLTVVDSLDDAARLQDACATSGTTLDVVLRVTPAGAGHRFDATGGKLGIDDGEPLAQALAGIAASPRLRLVGLHAHQLSHCADLAELRGTVRALVALAVRLTDSGSEIRILDLGGGLETRFLLERAGVSLAAFAEVLRQELHPLPDVEIVVEPGRFLVADAGLTVTTVVGRKRNTDRQWLITDAGASFLIPLPELVYHPVPLELRPDARWGTHAVADTTCDGANISCGLAELPELQVGDRLGLLNSGAYTSVFTSAWGSHLPLILGVDEGRTEVIFGADQRARFWESLHGSTVEEETTHGVVHSTH